MKNTNNEITCASWLITILGTVLVSGCSTQDFVTTPGITGISDVVDSGKPYVKGEQESLALDKAQKLAKALANWNQAKPNKTIEYHIGPDDILKIEILALEKPDQVSSLLRTVNKDGTINLIYGGKVKVGGLSVTDAQAKVVDTLAGRLIKNPQVTMSIEQYKSAAVVLTGAVQRPGVYYLNRDERSVLELLAEANGLSANAGGEMFIIKSAPDAPTVDNQSKPSDNTNLVVVDLNKLIDDGDLRLNLWVKGGDIITVQPKAKKYIYVLGYVRSPGMFELDEQKGLDAVRAVALAGGLNSAGRAENCFLLRRTEKGQLMIPVDLTKTIRSVKPEVVMQSGDTLVVGSSILAKLAEFVRPSVTAGASAGYSQPTGAGN
jgi:polysaccharide biosynthesis/export protein